MTAREPAERSALAERWALAEQWVELLDDELPEALALRRALHAAPDLSGAEEPTARAVLAAIRADPAGGGRGRGPVTVSRTAGTGRLIRIGPPGPAIGVRAELDALPLVERTGAGFASSTGAMHACGHDVHLAALTALARAARRLDLPFALVALLQPREEVEPSGADDVVAEGVLDRLEVRALVAAHVQPGAPAGRVCADPGPVNAAVDEVEIVVTGLGGHSGYPQLARDPVPALCRAVLALQDVLRSAVDPLQPAVVSITELAGSSASNVIPEVARAAGTVRTMREGDAQRFHTMAAVAVQGICAAHGCTGEYLVHRGSPALHNDPALAAAARGWLGRLGVPPASFASCGSDDFAAYGARLPILMMFVGTGTGPGVGPMLHDPHYLPGEHVVREVALALLAGWLAGAETLDEPKR